MITSSSDHPSQRVGNFSVQVFLYFNNSIYAVPVILFMISFENILTQRKISSCMILLQMVAMELMLTSKFILSVFYSSYILVTVIDSQTLEDRPTSNWKIHRFDYIVRDSRACGLGCNFQPERLLFLLSRWTRWIYLVALDILSLTEIVHQCSYVGFLKYSTYFILCLFCQNGVGNYNWTSNFYWLLRLMETMQVMDDEICYRSKDC